MGKVLACGEAVGASGSGRVVDQLHPQQPRVRLQEGVQLGAHARVLVGQLQQPPRSPLRTAEKEEVEEAVEEEEASSSAAPPPEAAALRAAAMRRRRWSQRPRPAAVADRRPRTPEDDPGSNSDEPLISPAKRRASPASRELQLQ